MSRKLITLLLAGLLILLLANAVMAAPQALDLSWWTVDGGGGNSSGGDYTISGTIGQPDAGYLTGGDFTLRGGFALGGAPTLLTEKLFLPLVLKE